jgi:deoxyribodipyrimidine photolyase-related protein
MWQCATLILVLGDQLDQTSAAFDDIDAMTTDVVWMAEVEDEATHVWCHKLRIALFLSAMRHFRDELTKAKRAVQYHELQVQPAKECGRTFGEILRADVKRLKPERLIVVEPGDWRVRTQLQRVADELGVVLEVRPDRHFYCSSKEFATYAAGRKSLLMEFFCRDMRKQHCVLMDKNQPEGGQWNFDHDNRETFGKTGPGKVPQPKTFRPDEMTRGVIQLVKVRFPDHPGSLDHFQLPVTRSRQRSSCRTSSTTFFLTSECGKMPCGLTKLSSITRDCPSRSI